MLQQVAFHAVLPASGQKDIPSHSEATDSRSFDGEAYRQKVASSIQYEIRTLVILHTELENSCLI